MNERAASSRRRATALFVSAREVSRRAMLLGAIAAGGVGRAAALAGSVAPAAYRWRATEPVLSPVERPDDRCFSVKDPTVVRDGESWQVFTTIRSEKRTHQIEQATFRNWDDAKSGTRTVLALHDGYFCAPQVFRHRGLGKWCLVYQTAPAGAKPPLQPTIVLADRLDDPTAWSAPRVMFDPPVKNCDAAIDFWCIGDDARMFLFFTSNDGRLWRSATEHARFPVGWSEPEVILRTDLFEASHCYRRGPGDYLHLIEAIGPGGRRYFQSYTASRLDGAWKPERVKYDDPFASAKNGAFGEPAWSESISHGELLRSGVDEQLAIDPERLEFLFQGALDSERAGRPYGRIPWRLGLLRAA